LVYTPSNQLRRVGAGGGVADDVFAVVTMYPCPGRVDVGELRGRSWTKVFGCSGDRGEEGFRDGTDVGCSAYCVNDDVERADKMQPRGGISHFANNWNN